MPKYLIQSKLTDEGVKGLLNDGGSSRVEAVSRAAESLGGKLESYYFAFGEYDAYVILDLPDNASASAGALFSAASGAFSTNTVVLLTPEEVDEAVKKQVVYRAPGQ